MELKCGAVREGKGRVWVFYVYLITIVSATCAALYFRVGLVLRMPDWEKHEIITILLPCL